MKARFLRFSFPGLSKIHCIFSQRFGDDAELYGNFSLQAGEGRSKVLAVRESLLAALKPAGLKSWAETNQVHGDRLVVADKPTGLAPDMLCLEQADGMMSSEENLGLVIRTADCQPILIAHRNGKHIMAIHAGWRGNRAKFPISAVEKFCAEYGLLAKDLFAVRGPSLGPANAQFINFEQEWDPEFRPWFNEISRCMDLWNLTRYQLQKAGIPAEQIYGLDICTLANREQFFSYRDKKCPGRQASIIWIAGEEEK